MVKGPPERTKAVIRRLPPTLPSADLKAAVDEICDGKYLYYTFVPGKSRYEQLGLLNLDWVHMGRTLASSTPHSLL